MEGDTLNLEKILNEIEKTKERIASYEERLKELEKKKFEAENLELISIVRKNKISRKDLDDFIKQKITMKEIENKESEEILNGKEEREKNKYQGI
jgi:hypothetical protein